MCTVVREQEDTQNGRYQDAKMSTVSIEIYVMEHQQYNQQHLCMKLSHCLSTEHHSTEEGSSYQKPIEQRCTLSIA